MADVESIADLGRQADRLLAPSAGRLVVAGQPVHPGQVHLAGADAAAVTELRVQLERAVRVRASGGTVALLLRDDAEVAGQGGDTGLIAELLADRQALEIALAGDGRIAALSRDRARDLQDVSLTGRVADLSEAVVRSPRSVAASSNRPTRRADSASEWSHRATSPRSPISAGQHACLEDNGFGPRDLADHVQDLGERDRPLDALAALQERRQAFQVVDGGRHSHTQHGRRRPRAPR